MLFDLDSKYSIPMEIHPRMRGSTVLTKVDNYQQPPESVRGGAVWLCRTVGAMDGAIKPPW